MGIMLMVSVPPATMQSAQPAMMRSAAKAMACSPDEQKRLIVTAEVSFGSPASHPAWRATFIPCSASGVAQPSTRSSTRDGSRPDARSSAALIAVAAMSSGRVSFKVPRGALPTAVRAAETITASFIASSPIVQREFLRSNFSAFKLSRSCFLCKTNHKSIENVIRRKCPRTLVAQRLAGLQHMLNALLRLALAAQRDERFTLKVEQILLGHLRRVRQVAASDNVS